MRFTVLHVTLNTNHAASSEAEVTYIISRLRRFIRRDLAVQENWRDLISITPSFEAIDKILVDAIGIEVGAQRHFIHAHFVVTIEHNGKILTNKKGTQLAWQSLMLRKMGLRGYVSVSLMSARHLNYTAKTSNQDTQLRIYGIQDAVTF